VTIIPRGLRRADVVHAGRRQQPRDARQVEGHAGGHPGGRAAEEIVFSDITTGASNDLEK
jgi:ATP-dependent Zn protease